MVELASFEFLNKFWSGFDIWNYSIFKSANARLECIATIKEDDLITTLIDKRVELVGGEMSCSTDDASVINDYLIWHAEGDDFFTYSNR